MRSSLFVLPAMLATFLPQAPRFLGSMPATRGAQSRPAADVVTSDAAKPGEIPAPKGTTQEDIRAMQGPKAMLDAEAKLKKLMAEGKLKGVERIVSFEEISSWPYEDGLKGLPASVKKLEGQKVLMTGFMYPIDQTEQISRFVLVPSLWSCCFGQPPDVNGAVRIEIQGGKKIEFQYDPLRVVGTFTIKANYDDDYCVDIYTIKADSVEVIH